MLQRGRRCVLTEHGGSHNLYDSGANHDAWAICRPVGDLCKQELCEHAKNMQLRWLGAVWRSHRANW